MAVKTEIFVGDVGTELHFDIGVDVEDVQVSKIKVQKPDKSVVEWTATPKTGTTEIVYTVQSGDFDQVGTYKFQPYIELPGWKGHGSISTLSVKATI